jgi:hypothetical protein
MSKADMVLGEVSYIGQVTDGIWTTVSNIDECVYKIKNVADVLEIMAVAETTETESGALWLMRDNLVQLSEKIEEYTQDLLDCRRLAMEEMEKPKVGTIKPKKGKK